MFVNLSPDIVERRYDLISSIVLDRHLHSITKTGDVNRMLAAVPLMDYV